LTARTRSRTSLKMLSADIEALASPCAASLCAAFRARRLS
jgi:hypothetical protein